ncbi:hypothetical protein FD755_011546 [Muntiacus reevesi]|uniref:Uncharacterized protein n=1 Tax=Muntiacus reevesi TaxID=9886 RepID=A0A5N3XTE8_MUNRE|nr:hypothetical protein FD755_011546 [Muntiacus reevesi]
MCILIVGLDAVGKTLTLYKVTVEYKNISFTLWDMGGQDKIWHLWTSPMQCMQPRSQTSWVYTLRHGNWYIQASCATSGDGLYEGLD